MNIEDVALTVVAAGVLALFVAERLWPAQQLPAIRGWWLRGLGMSALAFYLSGFFPLLWDDLLAPYQLVDGTGLGTIGGAIVGALVLELFNYGWHRALHHFDRLWRFFHQLHHSSERMDVPSALYFSPLDMAGWAAMGSLALTLGLGLTVEAVILANFGLLFLNVLQHANIRTPTWMGYFVARPEMHKLHHQRGVHHGNFATLPIWDLIFGTFSNPRTVEAEYGFYDGASARIPQMLIGRDINSVTPRGCGERPQARATTAAGAR